jgi:hypothetical protein
MRLHRLQGPSVWVGTVKCDVALWDWAAEGTDVCVTVLLHYWVQGCLWNWDDVIGEQGWLGHSDWVAWSRDGWGTVTELLGAGVAVALWLSYLEQGWLWHCDWVTWSRSGCGTVTELLGAGMAVAWWLSYLEQGWLWHCDGVTWGRDGCGTVTKLLAAGTAVAWWLRYWVQGWLWHCDKSYLEQGWLWHSDQVTGSRNSCGMVTELLGTGMIVALSPSYLTAGIAVALWPSYWAQEWLWFGNLNSLTESNDEWMDRNNFEFSTSSQGILPILSETSLSSPIDF